MNRYLTVAGLFMDSLPGALCQKDDGYLTGFHVSESRVAIIFGLILLLWLILKFMLKLRMKMSEEPFTGFYVFGPLLGIFLFSYPRAFSLGQLEGGEVDNKKKIGEKNEKT